MISKLAPLSRRAAISVISGAMFPASFRTGTTMETAGGAPLADVSLILVPFRSAGSKGRALWGDELPGNPFDAGQGRSRQRANASIVARRESDPAGREPGSNKSCARHPDNGAGERVA